MGLSPIELGTRTWDWSRVYIAGVVNATPDSFSDGGLHADVAAAVARARELARAGADLIDIGGESTRPGAEPVSVDAEIARVVPVIEAIRRELDVPLSVDTTKAEVARAALAAGAVVVNDISGGLFDPAIIDVTAAAGAVYILGHVRGKNIAEVHAAAQAPERRLHVPPEPASEHGSPIASRQEGNHAELPGYEEVAYELAARVAALPARLRHRTILDPCLGFGKGVAQNIALTRCAGELGRALGCPVMIGPSRKRFVRSLAGLTGPAGSLEADAATVGACLAAVAAGAHVLRVHTVELLKPALMVYEAIAGSPS